jgi:O-antigen ligase
MVRLWSEKSLWRKALEACGTVACLCALVFTYSRGAVLALLVMLVVALPILRLRLKHCLLGISLLGLSIMLAPRQFEQRLATLAQFVNAKESSTNTDSSFRQRALLMRAAWEMWREHPFLGVGAGNYAEQYPDFANRVGSTVSSYEEFGEKRYAHSLYLEIGAETGLAGIVVFSAILCAAGICGWRAFRSYRRLCDLKMARLVVSLMIGVLGYLATSLFLHASYPRHLWLLLALVAASAQIARKAASSSEIGGTE